MEGGDINADKITYDTCYKTPLLNYLTTTPLTFKNNVLLLIHNTKGDSKMKKRLTTLKATKKQIEERKRIEFGQTYVMAPEMPAKSAKSCTREQANYYWEMPPTNIWKYIQATYPDIADRINHRVERSKEIRRRLLEINRVHPNCIIKEGNEDESIDYIEDTEDYINDCNDDISDIETNQYSN